MKSRKVLYFALLLAIILSQAALIASALAAEIPYATENRAQGVPTLPPISGVLSGVVTRVNTGTPLKAQVTLYRKQGARWKKVATVRANSAGQYSFTKRRPGVYRLEFKAARHRKEYYNNATSLQSATDIVLTAGSGINNLNAELTPR